MPKPEKGWGWGYNDHTCDRCVARVPLKNRPLNWTSHSIEASHHTSFIAEGHTSYCWRLYQLLLKVIPAIAEGYTSHCCSLQAVHSVNRLLYQPLRRPSHPFQAEQPLYQLYCWRSYQLLLKVIPAIAEGHTSHCCSLQALHSVNRLLYQPLRRSSHPFQAEQPSYQLYCWRLYQLLLKVIPAIAIVYKRSIQWTACFTSLSDGLATRLKLNIIPALMLKIQI